MGKNSNTGYRLELFQPGEGADLTGSRLLGEAFATEQLHMEVSGSMASSTVSEESLDSLPVSEQTVVSITADQVPDMSWKSSSISEADTLVSEDQGGEEAIGSALAAESMIAVICSLIAGMGWGLHTGLSVLLGTGAYLFPYAIIFFAFFYQFARWHRSVDGKTEGRFEQDEAQYKKRKRTIAGGFLLAEVVKVVLTLGILIAAVMWYRQANWSVVLISFAIAIQANWAALWFALRRSS